MDQFPTAQFTPQGIAYYSFGQGQTTLLLVHGSFGTAMMWQRLITFFTQASFRVVALDLQGHGQSQNFDLAKTTMNDYAANVKSVLQIIEDQVVLVGHSMSGLAVLMAAKDGLADRVVSIDPSPSLEIQGEKSTEGIPDVYNAMEAGMPKSPQELMKAMPDIEPEMFSKLSSMLGMESGIARRQRKQGISIPKDSLNKVEVLFLGAELGNSLPFGISSSSTKAMADYYQKPFIEIAGASHPGMLVGKHAPEVAQKIIDLLKSLPASNP